MNFVDSIVVRLANAATRAALLDETALHQILAAAYDTSGAPAGAPFSAVFQGLTLGAALSGRAAGSVEWRLDPPTSSGNGTFSWNSPLGGPARVDALWRGAIAAQAQTASGRVTAVDSRFPRLDQIDAAIAAGGALPNDPAALEAARLQQLVALLRAGALDPAAITPALVTRWLDETGSANVGDFVTTGFHSIRPGVLRIGIEEAPAGPPSRTLFPVAAGVLVRDTTAATFSLADLLSETQRVRQQLREWGHAVPPTPGLRMRYDALVIWLVPPAWFDDPAWPGAAAADPAAERRRKRRAAAGEWLAAEGIGLGVVTGGP